MSKQPLGITDVVLRDAHQSLFATRLRLEDMLPIAAQLDRVGYWSVESWGGATFDACIRFLGEDPWLRLRELKAAMPNTRQQMLLRGQNLLGYRHYADDLVERFVERAADCGMDVFRIFDALNDVRNLECAMRAVKAAGRHAQGTLSYTISPVHDMDSWVALGRQLADMGADSLCIKDMAGLLRPYDAFELVQRLKKATGLRIHLHAHATTGLSTATALKCVEAGIDNIDTAISPMSMTYGHSPTETLAAILEGGERDPGLNREAMAAVADHFRRVRRRYAAFEGSLRGVDARILDSQVPGGMLTNMEHQLREQGAAGRLDEVLAEIPKVREDMGYPPLVTPTSQIVGTQAVLNVLSGQRYANISRETAALLRGEYGATPAPVNAELQARVLDGARPTSGRPADSLAPEWQERKDELAQKAAQDGIMLGSGAALDEDVLTYSMFAATGLRWLAERGNPEAFEPPPEEAPVPGPACTYDVAVDGRTYSVQVAASGQLQGVAEAAPGAAAPAAPAAPDAAPAAGEPLAAPLAGTVLRLAVAAGQKVEQGDPVLYLEAMKMETAVSAPRSGTIASLAVAPGDTVAPGDCLARIC